MGLFGLTMLTASIVLTGERGDSQSVAFQVSSEYHLDDAEALQEAHERFSARLVQLLADHGPCRDEGFLRRKLPELLQAAPEVEVRNTAEIADKPYGQLHRRIVTTRLPYPTLSRWANRLATERHAVVKCRVLGLCLSAALWAVSLSVAGFLDRWTRGYRRGMITTVTILTMLCGILLGTAPLWR